MKALYGGGPRFSRLIERGGVNLYPIFVNIYLYSPDEEELFKSLGEACSFAYDDQMSEFYNKFAKRGHALAFARKIGK